MSVAQECPTGQIAPEDAVSSEQCSCYPGFGGKRCWLSLQPVESHQLQGAVCMCIRRSSPLHGVSILYFWCIISFPLPGFPSLTMLPLIYCACQHPTCNNPFMWPAGSGDPAKPCAICPAATYSRGGDLEACKPCKFGYTSPVGSSSSKDCHPIDQCPAGTGGHRAEQQIPFAVWIASRVGCQSTLHVSG